MLLALLLGARTLLGAPRLQMGVHHTELQAPEVKLRCYTALAAHLRGHNVQHCVAVAALCV